MTNIKYVFVTLQQLLWVIVYKPMQYPIQGHRETLLKYL